MFHVIASITPLNIMDNEPPLQLEYNKSHNSHPCNKLHFLPYDLEVPNTILLSSDELLLQVLSQTKKYPITPPPGVHPFFMSYRNSKYS